VHINDSADRRGRTLFREAASAFVREAFQVISADEVNLSRDYESGITLAEVTAAPPAAYLDDLRNATNLPSEIRTQLVADARESETVEIRGLRGFVNAPSPLRFEWLKQIQTERRQPRTQLTDKYVEIAELSWGEIHGAIEVTTHALYESGIGFEFEQDQRWEI